MSPEDRAETRRLIYLALKEKEAQAEALADRRARRLREKRDRLIAWRTQRERRGAHPCHPAPLPRGFESHIIRKW